MVHAWQKFCELKNARVMFERCGEIKVECLISKLLLHYSHYTHFLLGLDVFRNLKNNTFRGCYY
jgi:hypothetical protein